MIGYFLINICGLDPMSFSPKVANEIARLMRDPNSMRGEWERMLRSTRVVATIRTSRACPPDIPTAANGRIQVEAPGTGA